MPGRPIQRALEARIEKEGGWPLILSRMADGETIASIARSFEATRTLFSTALHSDLERSKAVKQARKIAAEAVMDQSLEIADGATPQSERAARLKIEMRKFLASRWDPETWAEKQSPLVQINAGDLHLTALREVEAKADQRLQAASHTDRLLPRALEAELEVLPASD